MGVTWGRGYIGALTQCYCRLGKLALNTKKEIASAIVFSLEEVVPRTLVSLPFRQKRSNKLSWREKETETMGAARSIAYLEGDLLAQCCLE